MSTLRSFLPEGYKLNKSQCIVQPIRLFQATNPVAAEAATATATGAVVGEFNTWSATVDTVETAAAPAEDTALAAFDKADFSTVREDILAFFFFFKRPEMRE